MPHKGFHLSEETKRKIGLANKGKLIGKHLSEEHRSNISKSNTRYWLGKHRSEQTKRKISESNRGRVPWNTGLTRATDQRVDNLAIMKEGRPRSEETKRKLSESHKGQISWNKGLKTPEETKRKLSESHKGKPIWNKGLTKATDQRVENYAKKGGEKKKGRPLSEEHKRKIGVGLKAYYQTPEGLEWRTSPEVNAKKRAIILNCKDFKGSKGSARHQRAVEQVASWFQEGESKVEIEKVIHVNGHHRIIDVLVNEKFCIEVGTCSPTKIEELSNSNLTVIHIPYEFFGL